ncbi:PDZ domain-containing protein [Phragmitibacter flavus]|uniref:PDZ domain-containing protein n=1 Tax=Phragmitibacter flavus TaxID=2576071 RepID=A0A5R8KHK0_9BACT|nr:PDZ domain-containing protein [Phragmitibacter flavus]TLD71796.1 PDZ domain-containing protein [Phragmitibacter flavus]
MAHKKLISALAFFSVALIALPVAADVLPPQQRTNGSATLQPLEPLRQSASSSRVAIGQSRDATLSGVFVAEDGYILTKASEAEQFKPWKIFLEDGTDLDARLVKRDQKLDLLLLKIERQGLKAIEWSQTIATQAGDWLCSLTDSGRQIRLGVLSAKSRNIPDSGVVLGVLMGPNEDEDGVLIEEVAEDSPAQLAGLKPADLVISIDGEPVTTNKMLNQMVNSRLAGDVVKLRYLREGNPGECEVRLASRSRVMMNWGGEDFANGGTSVRTDNFPKILQHEIPLQPADMGSALYNLDGQAIGLNIARVDRVTTYALPADLFSEDLQSWIKEDRERELPVGSRQ